MKVPSYWPRFEHHPPLAAYLGKLARFLSGQQFAGSSPGGFDSVPFVAALRDEDGDVVLEDASPDDESPR